MSVNQALYDTLLDLIDEDFSTFKWFLSEKHLDNCQPIPRSQTQESATRTQIVSRLLSAYGNDSAKALTVVVLKKMNKNAEAQELEDQQFTEAASAAGPVPVAGPGPGASEVPPTAPAGVISVTAQGSSVVLAPNVSGGTAGTWNISITR